MRADGVKIAEHVKQGLVRSSDCAKKSFDLWHFESYILLGAIPFITGAFVVC